MLVVEVDVVVVDMKVLVVPVEVVLVMDLDIFHKPLMVLIPQVVEAGDPDKILVVLIMLVVVVMVVLVS